LHVGNSAACWNPGSAGICHFPACIKNRRGKQVFIIFPAKKKYRNIKSSYLTKPGKNVESLKKYLQRAFRGVSKFEMEANASHSFQHSYFAGKYFRKEEGIKKTNAEYTRIAEQKIRANAEAIRKN
jgi:hypothetical protein